MKELDIKLGYRCNNNCIFCLNREKRDTKKIPFKKIKTEIRSFVKKEGKKKLIISGGEPLTFDNFFPILEFAQERGVNRFEIQTNGRMLSYEEITKKLKKFKPIGFLVSLHFPNQDLYEKYTQADGFKQVISGIENLKRYNYNFTVNTVVMKPNLSHLESLIELLIKNEVKATQYRFIDGRNVMERYKKFVPRYFKASPTIKEIIDKYKKDIQISLNEFPFCVLGEDYLKYTAPSLNADRVNLNQKNRSLSTKKIHEHQFSYPNCDNCIYKSECKGIRKEYLSVYGQKEFTPIQQKKEVS